MEACPIFPSFARPNQSPLPLKQCIWFCFGQQFAPKLWIVLPPSTNKLLNSKTERRSDGITQNAALAPKGFVRNPWRVPSKDSSVIRSRSTPAPRRIASYVCTTRSREIVGSRISRAKAHRFANMSDRATANSAFFNALPPEVRISILTAAFGGRTLHIQECKPETLQSQREAPAYVPQTSRGALGNARQRLGRLFRTKTEEKKEEPTQPAMRRMKWCGRVCHRQPDQSPAEDSCLGMLTERLQKRGCSCGSPPELVIGAIGWLLTCRRA